MTYTTRDRCDVGLGDRSVLATTSVKEIMTSSALLRSRRQRRSDRSMRPASNRVSNMLNQITTRMDSLAASLLRNAETKSILFPRERSTCIFASHL